VKLLKTKRSTKCCFKSIEAPFIEYGCPQGILWNKK